MAPKRKQDDSSEFETPPKEKAGKSVSRKGQSEKTDSDAGSKKRKKASVDLEAQLESIKGMSKDEVMAELGVDEATASALMDELGIRPETNADEPAAPTLESQWSSPETFFVCVFWCGFK